MIVEIIEADLRKEQEERKLRERSGKFSPSAFGQCYRRQVWNRRNVEITDPVDMATLRVFRAGKVFHDMVQRLLPPHQVEVEVNTDDIHGFADIVTAEEVIDIKSIKDWGFKALTRVNNVVKSKPEHVLQVCTYAWILNIPKVRLVYINKDSLEIKEFEIVVADIVPDVLKELGVLRELWKREGDPEPIPRLYVNKDGKSKECGYCQFFTKCKGRSF